jgi:hypothetical protein
VALLGASPATLDRLLRRPRQQRGRQPRRLRPATGLKVQVPIRTWGEWHQPVPGALQADLVLHCGEQTGGFFLATLLAVDVATGWTELEPVFGLNYHRVRAAVHFTRQRLPFRLRHWHTDNGGEFLNHILIPWCQRHGITYSRGRPYRKNDQAYAEQRNWQVVRRIVGYDRFASRAAHGALHQVYAPLRHMLNFFRPTRKLVSKVREGSKVIKRYDRAQTPYQRLLAHGTLTPAARTALARQFDTLDPVALATDLERALTRLWALRDARRPTPLTAALR